MSDILISGMKMPKEGSWKTVRIYPDGTCAVPNWQGDCTFIKGAKAIPVPPHGRLIDADALKMRTGICYGQFGCQKIEDEYQYVSDTDIKRAPTIIPAEEGET